MKKVVVGMSGGVDSSVSAALLQKEGYEVVAFFMRNWEEESGECMAAADFEDVARTADRLQIPYYTLNFAKEYRERVFAHFLEELRKGRTPNPDILCNKEIKFDLFLEKALGLGADFVATGHYCRTDGEHRLLKGRDPLKDQSYFLHAVSSCALQKVLFPVGDLRKEEVRRLAKDFGLPTAEKKDSVGICFVGERDFKPFVSGYIGYKRGPFCTLQGSVVGEHDGAAFYTMGQRRGLGLGGEGAPWYVVGKDMTTNTVFVERGENHEALFSSRLWVEDISWVKEAPQQFPYECKAKIRYRQEEQPCTIFPREERGFLVEFREKQRAITPGQSVVFYEGDVCLGGGVIL